MRTILMGMAGAGAILLTAVTAGAQVGIPTPTGPVRPPSGNLKIDPALLDPHSDSKNGRMLRVFWSKAAGPVTIETKPKVNFACGTPEQAECWVYLKPTVKVSVRVVQQTADGPVAARDGQWLWSCKGQSGETCTVAMSEARNAGVNWSNQP